LVDLSFLRTATLLPHALVRPLALVSALILAMLTVVLAFWLVNEAPRNARQRPRSINTEASPSPMIASGPTPISTPVVTLKDMFDYQLNNYKANVDQLVANMKLQALFIVFTVLLVLRRSDSLSLFGNQLPLQWLHLFTPIVMIYLWLNFGFLLDSLIHTRLWAIEVLKADSSLATHYGKLLFQDSGFVDGWFLSFVDSAGINPGDYSGIDHNSHTSTAILMLLVFGTLLSALHACMIAIVFIGCRRYLRDLSSRFLPIYYGPPLVLLVILVVSHFQFAYGGSNRNYMQLYIPAVTIIWLAILLWVSVLIDTKVDPASVECLRRQRRLVNPGPPRMGHQHRNSPTVPTMALIADSLSTGFYVGSVPEMLPRMWRAWKGTWFVSEQGNQVEICSIFERLSKVTPISAIVHASARATVDAGGSRTLVDLLTNTRHLSYQVDEVLLGEFPDLLLVWIGHNDIDWRSRCKEFTDESCEILSTEFIDCYRKQMERLLKDALTSKKHIVIIVYGLINFESFFEARAQAEQRRQADATQFPYLEKDHDYFPSMRPEHRSGMSQLAQRCNEKLEEMCDELNEAVRRSDILMVYSDALSKAEIREADMLHQSDAWHPSSAGHRVLAQSAYEPIKEQLSYLGWGPE